MGQFPVILLLRYSGGQGKNFGIMVSREANNRHLHTRHHRVEGINTVMIEIFGQNPDKSVQITEMVKSEKNLETSTMR